MADDREIGVGREERAAVVDPRVSASPRISWGAIFGGAFAALGLWILLYSFGIALGLSTMDPNNPHSAKGSGIFTGIWSGLAPLIALFIGGLVAARLAGVFLRGYGALHGLVMWGLVALSGTLMVFTVVSSVVAGAASMGRSVVQGGGSALKSMASAAGVGSGGLESLGLDWNDMLAPVNQRLRAEGKPPVQAGQIQSAAKDAIGTAVRTGRFDRTQFENALAQNTALSRADAQELSQRVEARVGEAVQNAKQSAEVGALKAADFTGKAFWGIFIALALGLIAALLGGILGVPRVRVLREPGPRTVAPEPTPRGPLVTPREAYRRT